MCICVDAFGTGFDILVYMHLMRGECDSKLVRLFDVTITLPIVNYNNDQADHELIMS